MSLLVTYRLQFCTVICAHIASVLRMNHASPRKFCDWSDPVVDRPRTEPRTGPVRTLVLQIACLLGSQLVMLGVMILPTHNCCHQVNCGQFYAEENMNQLDENRRTPLMYAVGSGWQHVVEFLLERGVDSCLVDDRHTTALMQASSLGLPTILRLILDSGAGVNDVCLVSCLLCSVALTMFSLTTKYDNKFCG